MPTARLRSRIAALLTAVGVLGTCASVFIAAPAGAALDFSQVLGATPYIPLMTQADDCAEINAVNNLAGDSLTARLDQIASWYRHVHSEGSNRFSLGVACKGPSPTTLATKLVQKGVWASNYRNGSYVSQATSTAINFTEAADLETTAPLSLGTFWPGFYTAQAGDPASSVARLVGALPATATTVTVSGSGSAIPAGAAATWPYQSSRGTGLTPGAHSANTHDFVAWIRIDDELMQVTATPAAQDGNIVLELNRGLWGTAVVDHATGARVMSPTYVGSQYASATDVSLSGSPARDDVNAALRYAIKIWQPDAFRWIARRVSSTFGTEGYDTVWLDVSSCNQYNVGAADGVPVAAWNDPADTIMTRDAWGNHQKEKVNGLRAELPGWRFTGNSVSSSYDTCNEDLLANGFDAASLEHWMKNDPVNAWNLDWPVAMADNFKIQQNNWPAMYWVRWNYASSLDPAQYKRFSYGSLLLAHEATATRFQYGGEWGLGQPDQLYFWNWGTPLGAPSGIADLKVAGTSLYRRIYSNGMVVVNPTASAQTYAPGGTFYDVVHLDANGQPTPVTSVTVGPNDAAFLLNDTSPSAAIAPTVEVANASIKEGNSGVTPESFVVTLSKPSTTPVTVDYDTTDGTAIASDDYSATAGTLTFAPGELTKVIDVGIVGDDLHEADESFTVNLTRSVGATIVDAVATGTVVDDDPVPSITVDDADVVEPATGTATVPVAVRLSNPTDSAVVVDYATVDGTAGAPGDYAARTGKLYFSPGETVKTVYVTVNADGVPEGPEQFGVQVTGATNAGITKGRGVIGISDPTPKLQVADASVAEGPAGATTTMNFVVTLSTGSVSPTTVPYATGDLSAKAGPDYTGRAGTLTIPARATSAVISVPVIGDALSEGDEAFSLTLGTPTGATVTRAVARATIIDDDPLPALSIDDGAVVEPLTGTKSVRLTIHQSAPAGRAVSVAYATVAGTATSSADFTAASGTVTIPAGAVSTSIGVTVIGDGLAEGPEQFGVRLSAPVNAVVARGTASVQITDPTPTISIGDTSVVEGSGGGTTAARVRVQLSTPSAAPLSVSYTTRNGTAAAADFAATTGVLTFAPNETAKDVVVNVVADALDEPDEWFSVVLTAPVNATILRGSAKVTIVDDDPPPSISIGDVTVTEGNTGTKVARFAVSLSAPSGRAVSASFATNSGTALAGSDYQAAAGTVTIYAGATTAYVAVTIIGDTIVEPTESFSVVLSSPVGATMARSTGIGTIVNDDIQRYV